MTRIPAFRALFEATLRRAVTVGGVRDTVAAMAGALGTIIRELAPGDQARVALEQLAHEVLTEAVHAHRPAPDGPTPDKRVM